VLDRLARQVAVAAHGVVLAHEVARSREHVVSVREEERRRLYRDLHDGLGPSLAALALTVETARDAVPDDPARATDLLDRTLPRLRGTIDDVRGVVNGLRPPALDDLGLAGAVRELATRFGGALDVRVLAGEPGGGLAAATEVAAYRIVAEALANASRHAGASQVAVRLSREGAVLRVTVTDDGRGIGPDAREDGVGLASMRERAEEIGGGCELGVPPGGGTEVRAWLPVGAS
jgi:signal transduction histidine kinase